MRTRMLRLAVATGVTVLAIAPSANAQTPPEHRSCADFGENVAFLAVLLGGEFGFTASSVATSGPGAFRDRVVRREQAELCDPRET